MLYATSLAVLLVLPIQALAAVHDVDVGNGGLVFDPDTLHADVGDEVRFMFYPRNHSVAQATYDAPCRAQDAGIFSGYVPVSSGESSQIFTVTINDTNAIWLYCSEGDHCQQGMVMVINPVANSDTNITNFRAASARATSNEGPANNTISGGVISENTNSSSSSSSSASSASAVASSLSAARSSATATTPSIASGAIVTGVTSTGGAAATAVPSDAPTSSGAVTQGERGAFGTVVVGIVLAAGLVAWGLV